MTCDDPILKNPAFYLFTTNQTQSINKDKIYPDQPAASFQSAKRSKKIDFGGEITRNTITLRLKPHPYGISTRSHAPRTVLPAYGHAAPDDPMHRRLSRNGSANPSQLRLTLARWNEGSKQRDCTSAASGRVKGCDWMRDAIGLRRSGGSRAAAWSSCLAGCGMYATNVLYGLWLDF
jgi:hypothetical protein